jgi:hypothetical protein
MPAPTPPDIPAPGGSSSEVLGARPPGRPGSAGAGHEWLYHSAAVRLLNASAREATVPLSALSGWATAVGKALT